MSKGVFSPAEETIEREGIKYLSVSAMAKFCEVSASYIRAEISRKKIPAYRDQRGWLFVSEENVKAFKARRQPRFEPVP